MFSYIEKMVKPKRPLFSPLHDIMVHPVFIVGMTIYGVMDWINFINLSLVISSNRTIHFAGLIVGRYIYKIYNNKHLKS